MLVSQENTLPHCYFNALRSIAPQCLAKGNFVEYSIRFCCYCNIYTQQLYVPIPQAKRRFIALNPFQLCCSGIFIAQPPPEESFCLCALSLCRIPATAAQYLQVVTTSNSHASIAWNSHHTHSWWPSARGKKVGNLRKCYHSAWETGRLHWHSSVFEVWKRSCFWGRGKKWTITISLYDHVHCITLYENFFHFAIMTCHCLFRYAIHLI